TPPRPLKPTCRRPPASAGRRGEGQRLAVVGLTALGIEPIGMGRNVAEEGLRMGHKPVVTGRGFESAVGQTLRRAEPTEQQTGATQRVVGPAAIADDPPSRAALEELRAFTDPVQRLAPLTELRQAPTGVRWRRERARWRHGRASSFSSSYAAPRANCGWKAH